MVQDWIPSPQDQGQDKDAHSHPFNLTLFV